MQPAPSFRQLYQLLNVDISHRPQEEIIKQYIDRDSEEAQFKIKIKEVKDILSANNKAKIIFGSHVKAGRTFELRYLEYHLAEKEKFLTVFVSSTSELRADLWKQQNIYFTDLFFLLITKTIKKMVDKGLNLNEGQINELQRLLHDAFGKDITFPHPSELNILHESLDTAWNKIKSDLTGKFREKAANPMFDLINAFNNIIKECITDERNQISGVSIIVDDLDKTSNDVYEFLYTYRHNIKDLDCCLVITMPPSFFFNPKYQSYKEEFNNIYDRVYFLPPFQVHNREWQDNKDQIKLMVDIIKRKIAANSSPIPDDILMKCARLSGGIMPDFILMLKSCCLRFMDTPPSEVKVEMLNQVLKEVFNEQLVSNDYMNKMKNDQDKDVLLKVSENQKKVQTTSFNELLMSKAILEYTDISGQKWYDIHPAVGAFLKDDHPVISTLLV